MSDSELRPPINTKLTWAGRVVTALLAAVFSMSGVMKLRGGPELAEGFGQLGLPVSMATPLGIVELVCVVLYLIPTTSVVGAILLTGYMGGAICTHWRVGDPFFVQILFAIAVWIGIYLREPRLWHVMPLRRGSDG